MIDEGMRAAGFQFAPQASAVIDLADRQILGCNRAFSVLLGFSEEELVGRPLDSLLPTAGGEALRDHLEATRTSPWSGHDTTLCLRREDGTDVRVRLRSRLIDEGQGPLVRAVVAIDEIEQPNDDQDAFFAMLAHELRNRLSNLRLAVQILDREDLPDGSRWRWGLSVMDQQVAELAQMTDDLLDVSRMARGRLMPRRDAVDLRAVAIDVVQTWNARTDDAPPVRYADGGAATVVYGEESRLRQVILLLLRLAETPDGDALIVSLDDDGQHARLTVRGPGIGPDLFPNDLDLFAAAARAATVRPGLGLEPLLVGGLVARMDGALVVRETFVEVVLPLAAGAHRSETTTGTATSASTPAGAAPHEIVAPGPHPCRLLVVDDDRGAANTLSMLLTTSGHTVAIAHDAERGFQMAIDNRPQVALLDLKLPGTDGYTLARRLRMHFGPGLKLIALTGYDAPDDRAKAKAAGFDHHLVKPVDVELLKSLID